MTPEEKRKATADMTAMLQPKAIPAEPAKVAPSAPAYSPDTLRELASLGWNTLTGCLDCRMDDGTTIVYHLQSVQGKWRPVRSINNGKPLQFAEDSKVMREAAAACIEDRDAQAVKAKNRIKARREAGQPTDTRPQARDPVYEEIAVVQANLTARIEDMNGRVKALEGAAHVNTERKIQAALAPLEERLAALERQTIIEVGDDGRPLRADPAMGGGIRADIDAALAPLVSRVNSIDAALAEVRSHPSLEIPPLVQKRLDEGQKLTEDVAALSNPPDAGETKKGRKNKGQEGTNPPDAGEGASNGDSPPQR